MKGLKAQILILMILTVMIFLPVGYTKEASAYQSVEGYIKDLNASELRIEIEDYEGSIKRWQVTPDTVLLIDDTPAGFKDFKIGMEIYAEYNRNSLTYIESWSTENPGYIPPNGKVRSGIVKKIDRNQLILRLTTGKEETYFTSPATIAIRNGLNVPLSTLYEGDMVRLYFDEKDSTIISRMNIQGDSVKIKGLYKGQLDASNLLDNTLVLKDAQIFQNGGWQEMKDILRIDYSKDFPVYCGGLPLSYNNMKYFQGKTAYLAVKDFFSKDMAEKMVIKSQYETTFSDKIEEINWYASAFELKNKRNIQFDEGTIFIKNQRLVDGYSMVPGCDAFVVADGRGSKALASVVYIYNQDINNSNIGQYYLYAGKLDKVVENQVTIEDFFILNRNDWESFDDEKELYYDNDTYIFDMEKMKQITPQEFFAMDYAVDEDSSSSRRQGLKSWHAYAYTDGDRIVAIALKKDMDSLLRQRVTIGTVDKVEEDALVGIKVTLRDAKDWSSRNEKWMPKSLPVKMRVEKALLIKDDRTISRDELKPGDNIYAVRDDFEGKFLLVK
ncbi:hypothetical protein [Tepidanaerobacter sp. EBM-38]|uniref:hypothetical protein n=1 Tax=Tepidanaerobacter sp. EBM-38 TaxID=1918496 RepID=UPI000AEE3D2A|nr:hypothetical protein [Tepidanaerobacter sp. EBM-38]